MKQCDFIKEQKGVSIIEMMVSLFLITILFLSVLQGSVLAISTANRSVLNSLANQLASKKIEALGMLDPSTLTPDMNSVEDTKVKNFNFTVTTTVVVNPDESREVSVTAETVTKMGVVSSEITNSFPLRGFN